MPFLNGSESITEKSAFEKLVNDLSSALGPSSGLDSSDVDPMEIQLLMERYISNSDEWASYALGDASRTYTRNLIDEGNGKSNLVRKLSPLNDYLADFVSADSRLEPWEREYNSRPCKRTLRDEGKSSLM